MIARPGRKNALTKAMYVVLTMALADTVTRTYEARYLLEGADRLTKRGRDLIILARNGAPITAESTSSSCAGARDRCL